MRVEPRPPALPGAGLRRSDFRPLAVNGWGDGYNSYAHSMAWFRDNLYVGSTRANLHLGKLRDPAPRWPVYPVKCPDDLLTLDVRARIWRWSPATGKWSNVHTAGTMKGVGGRTIPTEIGYRGMTVFKGRGDTEPVLYVSSYSGWGALRDPDEDQGPRIFRSEDGQIFQPISAAGLGREGISAFRSLVPFKGRLFTSPVGTIRSRPNVSPCPMVFESADPASGEWQPVSEPGFGNPQNVAIFEMAAFNGFLYAGTGNIASGFELWKTDAEGKPPYRWQQVLRMGAYRGNLSEGVLSLCVFGDALYVGTAIQDGGYDREYRVGPSPGEVLRVFPDDTWEIVAGTARLTPLGVKVPVSGLRPGLNNFFNGYIWRMCVHDGWLYVGTFDWSGYMRYFAVDQWPEILREFVARLGVEETIRQEGGCDLMRTRDGNRWFCVTRTGFDNPYNSGIRTMVSTPHGLVVGTINPFGPEVAVRRDGEWQYVSNLRGGLEVWLGEREPGAALPTGEEEAADEIVGQLPLAAGGDGKAPQRRRVGQLDPAKLELDKEQLRELAKRIDVRSVRPDLVSFASKFHHMRTEGAENIPREGGVVITCNHVGSPVFAGVSFNSEDGVLFAHVLLQELGRPVRFLADHGFYDTELAARMCGDTVDKLGFVPISIGNGIRLLEMGEPVVVYPEGRYSSPDYKLQPFFWGFAKVAFQARAPIVPSILIGPHESRRRVERNGRLLYLNPYSPLPADYKFVFLPPVDIHDYVDDLSDREALGKFTEMIRRLTQEALDRECAKRPEIEEIRALQSMYGQGSPNEAGARGV